MREMLIRAMDAVEAGSMEPSKAKAIANLAQQVNASMLAELEARRLMLIVKDKAGEVIEMGSLPLGENVAALTGPGR